MLNTINVNTSYFEPCSMDVTQILESDHTLLNIDILNLCDDLLKNGLHPYVRFITNEEMKKMHSGAMKKKIDNFCVQLFAQNHMKDRIWDFAYRPLIQRFIDETISSIFSFECKVKAIQHIKNEVEKISYPSERLIIRDIGLCVRPSSYKYYKQS